MSTIVMGIGTSHSPLLAISPEMWADRAKDDYKKQLALSDGRTLGYDELLRDVGALYAENATIPVFASQLAAANEALDRLADDLAEASPDLAIIVGDDQEELFDLNNMPAMSIYYGQDIVMHPRRVDSTTPAWRQQSLRGYSMDAAHRHRALPDYALGLIERLVDQGVDLGAAADVPNPEKAGFGHAYGFVVERLFRGRQIPVVPVMLNTYYPPNVPRPARCFEVGRALRAAIESMPDSYRVAIIASGGLSHFVTDRELDEGILNALEQKDRTAATTVPMTALRDGSSEILNWIFVGGALESLSVAWRRYIPVYRTPAGTGIGLAFMSWR